MKKKFYYAAMFAAGLMTISTSCSNEDEIINEGENSEVATGEQVIVLDMQDTDVLSTKSRPLYSTENKGAENVTDVQLFVFEMDNPNGTRTLKNILTINDWNLAVDYDYGRKYTLKLTGDDKLAKGKSYTIVAVGQDQDTQTVAPFIIAGESGGQRFPNLIMNNFSDNVWNPNTTAGSNFLDTEAVESSSVAEIFSGSSVPFTVSETGDGGFSATVLLKRQVAGVIGYFNRIPAWVVSNDDTKAHASTAYVRLVSSNRNKQVDLTYNLDVQTDDATNGTKTESEVNGFSATAVAKDAVFGVGEVSRASNAYTLYEIDLSKWFKINPNVGSSPSFISGEEYWGASTIITHEGGEDDAHKLSVPLLGANWSNGINSGNVNPKVQTNSVLAGQFVIPFNKQGEYGTLQLQLLDSAKNVIRVWDVKLDTKSIAEGKDTEKDYNIYRNHLYQIGQRGAGDTGEGGGPDEPQPLDKDQILTIKINDQWEFIHDLEID